MENIPGSWTVRFHIKMTMLSKLISRFNATGTKIPDVYQGDYSVSYINVESLRFTPETNNTSIVIEK